MSRYSTHDEATAAAEAAKGPRGDWAPAQVIDLLPGTEVRIEYTIPVEVEFGAIVIDEARAVEGVLTGFETSGGAVSAIVRGRGPFGMGGPVVSKTRVPVERVNRVYRKRMSSAR